MRKRISEAQRNKLKIKKESKNKLDKLIALLIKKNIISKEDL